MSKPEPRRVSASRNLFIDKIFNRGIIHLLFRVSEEMYIYLITNKINGKQYVGRSIRSNPKQRWKEHKSNSRKPKVTSAIHLAMQKYGIENFSFDVIDYASDAAELASMESRYIVERNTLCPNGYNLELHQAPNRLRAEESRRRSAFSKQGVSGRVKKTSRYCGVVLHPTGWRTSITYLDHTYAKSFENEDEAAIQYDRFVLGTYGPDAKINFPELRTRHTVDEIKETLDLFMIPKPTSSKYRNVTFSKELNKWKGRVCLSDGSLKSRICETEVEAAEFVDVVRVLFKNDRTKLNFPDKLQKYDKITISWFNSHCGNGSGFMTNPRGRCLFTVKIPLNGTNIDIGSFKTKEEASNALNQARIKYDRHWTI